MGVIMLTHELNNFTMSEAVKFHDQLKSAFKYMVPMGVATNQTQPYIETNYSLPSFEQCTAKTIFLIYVLTLVQTSAVRPPSLVVFHPPRRDLLVQQGLGPRLGPRLGPLRLGPLLLGPLLLADRRAQTPLVPRIKHHLMVWECLLRVQHSSVLL
jgi:hypothetical protein